MLEGKALPPFILYSWGIISLAASPLDSPLNLERSSVCSLVSQAFVNIILKFSHLVWTDGMAKYIKRKIY